MNLYTNPVLEQLEGAIEGSLLGTTNDVSKWSVNTSDGTAIILPDSVAEFSYRGEQSISDAPMPEGSFASYNKVKQPFDIRMVMTCSGSGSMSRQAFLQSADSMLRSIDLYDVVTPDHAYQNCNLVHFDYSKRSDRGMVMIIAEFGFRQARVSGSRTVPTVSSDSAATNTSTGTASVSDATTSQDTAASS